MDTSLSYLDRQFPHGLIEPPNPLFELERRRLRRLQRVEDLKSFSLNLLAVPVLFGVFACMCVQDRSGAGGVVIGGGSAFITAGMFIATDMYYTLLTISSISRYITSGQWDVVKITLVHNQDVL